MLVARPDNNADADASATPTIAVLLAPILVAIIPAGTWTIPIPRKKLEKIRPSAATFSLNSRAMPAKTAVMLYQFIA